MICSLKQWGEIESFYNLFNDIVDDVTVIQYNERGGEISSLKDANQKQIKKFLKTNEKSKDTPFMVTADDDIYISKSRKPCEQLIQILNFFPFICVFKCTIFTNSNFIQLLFFMKISYFT